MKTLFCLILFFVTLSTFSQSSSQQKSEQQIRDSILRYANEQAKEASLTAGVIQKSMALYTASNECLQNKDYVCAEENLIAQEKLILKHYPENSEQHLELITFSQMFYTQIGDYYSVISSNKSLLKILDENPELIADQTNPYLPDSINYTLSRAFKIAQKKFGAYGAIASSYWALRNYDKSLEYYSLQDSISQFIPKEYKYAGHNSIDMILY